MIYLFEDKEGRMMRFTKGELKSTVLKRAVMDCTGETLHTYVGEHFSDASAILFHVSYVFPGSGMTNDAVREAFLSRGIPFVYFSGGSHNSIGRYLNGTLTADMDSESMYTHLPIFLEKYEATGKVDLQTLVFGGGSILNSLLSAQVWAGELMKNLDPEKPAGPAIVQKIISGLASRLLENELEEEKKKLTDSLRSNKTSITPDAIMQSFQHVIDKF